MTNYIGKIDAEWVDPAVELPEEGWYTVRWHSGQVATSSFDGQKWGYPSVSAWLRVGGPSTDIPRAQVQAAVDEIAHERSISHKGLLLSKMGAPAEKFHEGRKSAFGCSVSLIKNHTGITPSKEPQ